MSRSGKFNKRIIKNEPIYNNYIVSKFINNLMQDGKKCVVYKVLKAAFELILIETKTSGIKVLEHCLEKIRPKMGLRSKKVASSVHQIPVGISNDRSIKLGLKILVKNIRTTAKSEGVSIHKIIAKELCGIWKGESTNVIKHQERYEKLCDDNKIYLHFINENN